MNESIKNIAKNFLLGLFVINFIAYCFCYCGLKFFGLIIPYYFITTTIFFVTFIVLSFSSTKNVIENLLKTKSFLIFVMLSVWIIIGYYFLTSIGYPQSEIFWKAYLNLYLFPYFLTFLSIPLAMPRLLSLKQLYKLFIFTFYIIAAFALIDFVGKLFNIRIINDAFTSLVNIIAMIKGAKTHTVYYGGMPRASGVFEEAQYLAMFAMFSFPVLFFYSRCKEAVFKNILLDKFLKKTCIVLATLLVVLAQSPIWVIFYAILLPVMYIKFYRIRVKKALIAIFPIIAVLLYYLKTADLRTTFLGRITPVLNATSYESLAFVSGSLISRISSWINQFIIFMQHPIFGVGFVNMPIYWYDQLLKSPVPITLELYYYATENIFGAGSPFLFRFLSETGIIGTVMFYGFLIYLYKSINKLSKNSLGIEKSFIDGLKYFTFLMIVLSWYDFTQINPILFAYLGCAQAVVLYKKTKRL